MLKSTKYATPEVLIRNIDINKSFIKSVGKISVKMPERKYSSDKSEVYVYSDGEEHRVGKIDFTPEKAIIRPMNDMRKVIAKVDVGDE